MKIIKNGLEENRKIIFKCSYCNSVLEAQKKEFGKLKSNIHIGLHYNINCPVCKKTLSFIASTIDEKC